MDRQQIVAQLDKLPLFAWAVWRIDGGPPPAFVPAAPPRPPKTKPAPPPADAIWKPRVFSFVEARAACVAAFAGAPAPTREPTPAERLLAAICADARIARAIGAPEALDALDAPSTVAVETADDRLRVDLGYHGAREHLEEAVSALGAVARSLGLTARTATAQVFPLRARTARAGKVGWRASVFVTAPAPVVRTQENAATLAA